MTRSRQFGGAAKNVFHFFLSRNNDIDGYWAPGHMLSECLSSRMTVVTIDLMTSSGNNLSPHYAPALSRLRAVFRSAFGASDHVPTSMVAATLSFEIEGELPVEQTQWESAEKIFRLTLSIICEDGFRFERKATGKCRPHFCFQTTRRRPGKLPSRQCVI